MVTGLVLANQDPARSTLEQRSLALEEALQRAAEGDRRKDEYLATLAHELRNQLGPTINSLELMRLAPADVGLREQARAIMERRVLHMKRLVDDLLDISRIGCDRLAITKVALDLGLLLEQTLEASRPVLEGARHAVRLALPSQPLFVAADSIRLAQVFDNLFSNAGKYTDPGGCIDVALEQQRDEAVVRVTDNGIGIPSNLLATIFERFVQVEHSGKRARGGFGIGLALAKELVELHGGTIVARSGGVGRGSEFIVRLPLLTRPVLLASAPSPIARLK